MRARDISEARMQDGDLEKLNAWVKSYLQDDPLDFCQLQGVQHDF